ncbi:MAG TPA: hypothetical protein VK763_19995 [Terriglobales bacterium]|jgi:hypothetical protein|nr:hypothetical protein [Terriglobales bacterium]
MLKTKVQNLLNERYGDLSTVICHGAVYLLLKSLVRKLEAKPLLRKQWDFGPMVLMNMPGA